MEKPQQIIFLKREKKKIDPYIIPMIFINPKMHENPLEKAEKNLRMAENGK